MNCKFNSLADISHAINNCKLCRLCATRNLAVPGEGPDNATIMFVGEAPGHINDQLGKPFVGHGGRIFDGILESVGLDRESIFITNAVKCWPPENRKPTSNELMTCKIYLEEQINLIKPKLIFAFGATSFLQLTANRIKMKEEHGKIIMTNGIIICAVFHPNGIRYIKGGRQTIVNCINDTIHKTGLSNLKKSQRVDDRTEQSYDLFN
jgi:uracil-DNA glycosylase family 4